MQSPVVLPLDLMYQGHAGAIAAYLVPYAGGAVLVEAGPGSTLVSLRRNLRRHHLEPGKITHVLLTHIHLDHAGAAGWLAHRGAQVYLHPDGAPHLVNPEKLLVSARRIYGENLEKQWGAFQPVPAENVHGVQDGEEILVDSLRFKALYTPGHAGHHLAWALEDICFSGDVAGVRLPGPLYIRLPLVPPELNMEHWAASLRRLRGEGFMYIAPTHYGIYADMKAHLDMAQHVLEDTLHWVEKWMSDDPPIEILRQEYVSWLSKKAGECGVGDELVARYQIANPAWISADGLQRYWRKHRNKA